MRRTLPALALTAALAASLTGCGGSSGSGGSSAKGVDKAVDKADGTLAVRAASTGSTKTGSSRYALTSLTTVQGTPITIKGDGVFDYAGKKGSLTLTLPTGKVEERIVDGTVYLALSQQPGSFYALKSADLVGTSLGTSTDPGASFAVLGAAKDGVTVVGEEKVRDADTTHYRGQLDIKSALASSGGVLKQMVASTLGRSGVDAVPFDAWIDDQDRVRKYQTVFDVPASAKTGGQPVHTDTTIELYDYGTPVSVTAPPASAVKDGAPLLAALKRATG